MRKPFGESLKPVEPRGQLYREAARAHAADRIGPAIEGEKALLTLFLQGASAVKDDVTVEGMLEVLFARALLSSSSGAAEKAGLKETLDLVRSMDAKQVEKVLDDAAAIARLLRRERLLAAKTLRKALREGDAAFVSDNRIGALEAAADLPPVVGEVLERKSAAPWDVLHDRHLGSRRAAWALGIVRYARAVAPERGRRITAALSSLGESMGERGSDLSRIASLWTMRRPLVVLPEINAYTIKLVHDLWLADPAIAAVNTGAPVKGNPFATLRIPFVEDQKGYLKAFLSLCELPALVEPRLGGFTVTAATGLMRLTRLPKKNRFGKGFAIPAWMRTFAEIGLLNRHDNALKLGTRLSPAVRLKFFSLYRELIRVPIEGDRFVDGPEADAIRSARAQLLDAREELLLLIAREEEKAERELEARVRRRNERMQKRTMETNRKAEKPIETEAAA